MRLTARLSVALRAAERASEAILSVYATQFHVDHKAPGDPVTEADRAANACIVGELTAAFPDDGICAEESDDRDSARAAARGGLCWYVDPMDGTREFVARNGEFCVMIGLAEDGKPTLGVVAFPALRRTMWGIVGEGAFVRDVDGMALPLRIADPPHAFDRRELRMVVSRSHCDSRVLRAAEKLGTPHVRPCGSVGLKVAEVLEGRAEAYVHAGGGPKLWDGCAPEAVARAAGARVCDGRGRTLRYDSSDLGLNHGLLVCVPWARDAIVEALRDDSVPF